MWIIMNTEYNENTFKKPTKTDFERKKEEEKKVLGEYGERRRKWYETQNNAKTLLD